MLKMDNFEWIKITTQGLKLRGNANFGSALVNSKLVIFGGIKENLLPCNDTYVIELDQERVEFHTENYKDQRQKHPWNLQFKPT
mmetsp:Transcript_2011/g.1811  ORF Transcript_2011/g.1811 Transcript_2011/m.1811 type:complete len:84 (+) Transcript_2011:209-460(+)